MLPTASARPGRGVELHVGEMFGRYRLGDQLGSGGVGEVWRAVDTSLDRVVAIKMLLPRFRDDPDSTARFHREARLAAQLRHPHIVRVHTFGEIDDRLYLDMELIQGESAAAELGAGPLDPQRAGRIVEVVADALDTAHALDGPPEQRMVHRDVKPANILLERHARGREHAYLVDFGMARTVAAGPRITSVGTVVGTPAYMAPELWDGRPADHRVDVYALGVTAFELLGGELPFSRGTVEGLAAAHLTEPPPVLSSLRPELPAAVDGVLIRAMAKDPATRYATAGELATALLTALRDAPGPSAPDAEMVGEPAPGSVTSRPSAGSGAPAFARTTVHTGLLRTVTPGERTPADDPPSTGGPAGGAPAGGTPEQAGLPQPAATPAPPPVPRSTGPGPSPPSGPRRPYLASPPHFAGLAATALLIPLYAFGGVRAPWALALSLVLLYCLGAIVVGLLLPRR